MMLSLTIIFLCILCELFVKKYRCCCLPAIAVDCPALKPMQIAADGRGGRVCALKQYCILKIEE